jgi:hypothetical protein
MEGKQSNYKIDIADCHSKIDVWILQGETNLVYKNYFVGIISSLIQLIEREKLPV